MAADAVSDGGGVGPPDAVDLTKHIPEGETEDVADAPGSEAENDGADDDEKKSRRDWRPWSAVRVASVLGAVAVVAVGSVVGWLGYETYQDREQAQLRALFIQVGRQGALNLTTLDWQTADADVQRILDSAVDPFHAEFAQRQVEFIAVMQAMQSSTTGEITEAGLETFDGEHGEVLVSVNVNTSVAAAPDQPMRYWRMRIDVQRVDDGAKVSNVEFVQ